MYHLHWGRQAFGPILQSATRRRSRCFGFSFGSCCVICLYLQSMVWTHERCRSFSSEDSFRKSSVSHWKSYYIYFAARQEMTEKFKALILHFNVEQRHVITLTYSQFSPHAVLLLTGRSTAVFLSFTSNISNIDNSHCILFSFTFCSCSWHSVYSHELYFVYIYRIKLLQCLILLIL